MSNLPEHIRASCEAIWGPFEPDPELEVDAQAVWEATQSPSWEPPEAQ